MNIEDEILELEYSRSQRDPNCEPLPHWLRLQIINRSKREARIAQFKKLVASLFSWAGIKVA